MPVECEVWRLLVAQLIIGIQNLQIESTTELQYSDEFLSIEASRFVAEHVKNNLSKRGSQFKSHGLPHCDREDRVEVNEFLSTNSDAGNRLLHFLYLKYRSLAVLYF